MTGSLDWSNPRLAGRVPELDGLRGLAILLVLALHFVGPGVATDPGSWQHYAAIPLQLAWSGVDLFFVLSGFLIGGILIEAKNSDTFYQTFYLRRIHRIVPVYFIWLAAFMVGLHMVTTSSQGSLQGLFNTELPVWSYPLFVQNLFMATRHTFGPEWLGITWSLAIEEQFYLVLPVLVRKVSLRGIGWIALGSIAGAPVVRSAFWAAGAHHITRYVLLPCRADSLAVGLLIAIATRNQTAWAWLTEHRKLLLSVLWISGSLVAALATINRGVFVLGFSFLAVFYGCLLALVLGHPNGIEAGLSRSRFLRKLGIISYSTYIIHQGINALVHSLAAKVTGSTTIGPSIGITMVSLTLVIVIASASWRFLESPLIHRAHTRYQYSDSQQQPQRSRDRALPG